MSGLVVEVRVEVDPAAWRGGDVDRPLTFEEWQALAEDVAGYIRSATPARILDATVEYQSATRTKRIAA